MGRRGNAVVFLSIERCTQRFDGRVPFAFTDRSAAHAGCIRSNLQLKLSQREGVPSLIVAPRCARVL